MKMICLFLGSVITGVSKDPGVMCFVSMQCLQLLGREGTDLASLMASDDDASD